MADKVVKGLNMLVNPSNTAAGIKYEDVEKEFLANGLIEKPKDPTERFKASMNDLAKSLNLNFETPQKSAVNGTSRPSPHGRDDTRRNDTSRRDDTSRTNRYQPPPRRDSHSSSESGSDRDESPTARRDETPPKDRYFTVINDARSPTVNRTPLSATRSPHESELSRRTREEEHHEQVRSIMREDNPREIFTVERERREDMKTSMLVEIDSIWAALAEDSVDLTRITRPSKHDTFETIEEVLKTLRMKLDQARYSSLADEFILAGAGVVEDVFDGKNVYFGKFAPNMSGWSKQVNTKLHRMKHDTSNIVSNVMNKYDIGPGTRIFLELIPNAFMHAKNNREHFGKETLNNDPDLQRAIRGIRSVEQ